MAKTAKKSAPQKVESWRRVTRPHLAALFGCHPDTVSDYTRDGMPVLKAGGHGRESSYDSVACLEWHRVQYGQDAKAAAQTEVYETQAIMNRMKIAAQRGQLVPRSAVVTQGQHYTKAWMAKVRGLPRVLSNAGVIDRSEEGSVREILIDLLSDISTGWRVLEDLPAEGVDGD